MFTCKTLLVRPVYSFRAGTVAISSDRTSAALGRAAMAACWACAAARYAGSAKRSASACRTAPGVSLPGSRVTPTPIRVIRWAVTRWSPPLGMLTIGRP
jgi:hypothetical protein